MVSFISNSPIVLEWNSTGGSCIHLLPLRRVFYENITFEKKTTRNPSPIWVLRKSNDKKSLWQEEMIAMEFTQNG
jgi:hypothetical protein